MREQCTGLQSTRAELDAFLALHPEYDKDAMEQEGYTL